MCAPNRRCVAGSWCWGDHDGHGAFTTGPYCPSCLVVSARDLHALVLDYADLEQHLPKINTRGVIISGTRELPVPIALGVDALQRAIWHTLTTWEEIVREIARLPDPPARTRHGWAVQHAVAILEPRVDLLADLGPVAIYDDGLPVIQTGADALAMFTKLHRRARAMLGLTRRVEVLYGKCPACGWEALRRDSGSETVHCAQCEHTRPWDEYRRWLALVYADAKATLKTGGSPQNARRPSENRGPPS